jgi:AcrR family transcriptional regulator
MIVPIAKKTPKAQKSREQILQAAFTLFREKGYEETSMREIAKEAEMAVGAAYYYFRTKDEMILEIYSRTQRESEIQNRTTCSETRSFRKRISTLLFHRLGLIGEHRKLFVVLTQKGIDPSNSLSPFSGETANLRKAAVRLIEDAIEGSDLKISSTLRPILPQLLWFFQMAVILFWALDTSRERWREFLIVWWWSFMGCSTHLSRRAWRNLRLKRLKASDENITGPQVLKNKYGS